MFPRKYKKQRKIKRFLLKLFNIYAFEKETLNIVNPDFKNSGNNFYKLNDKSLNLSTGYLNLDRKIKKLDIFYRYAPNNQLWNSTERWKRIIPNINKIDLKRLEDDVRLFEPLIALKAGLDGLTEIKKLILRSKKLLKLNGKLIFEIGLNQEKVIKDFLIKNGYYINKVCKDLSFKPRVIISTIH